jgi:hypothetical protein
MTTFEIPNLGFQPEESLQTDLFIPLHVRRQSDSIKAPIGNQNLANMTLVRGLGLKKFRSTIGKLHGYEKCRHD